ncbi:hypothetical protein OS21_25330 [Dickeya oryzae]
MKKHVFTFLTATLVGAVMTGTALADEFSLGVGAVGGTALYRGDSGHVYPFPMVNYDGENFLSAWSARWVLPVE